MRSARVLLTTMGMLGLVAATAACGVAQANTSGVWVQVSPSSVTAGFNVTVRASCGDNNNPATVQSEAFGSLTVQPVNSFLQAEVVVPAGTPEGGYDVTLSCRTGAKASTTLWVINKGARRFGPHTGGGFLADHADGTGASTSSGPGPALWLAGGAVALAGAVSLAIGSTRQRRRRHAPR